MTKDFNKGLKYRIIVIQALLVASIFLMGARSFDIQIFQGKELTIKAENDYSRTITIKGERGQILDRSMNKLATSIDAISINASPAKVKDPILAAKEISSILGLNRIKLEKTLSSKRMFAWVARRVSPEQANKIKLLKGHIGEVLSQMDEKFREVLVLRFLEEKDYKEISDILKKPMGTVATLLNRAKKVFKKELDQYLTNKPNLWKKEI